MSEFWSLKIISFSFLLLQTVISFSQTDTNTIKTYDFIQYNLNKLSGSDSSKSFNNFWQHFDSLLQIKNSKINITHFGGSHLQADIHSNYIREHLQLLDDSLQGSRGFIFPFKIAETNNPSNYTVSYTGKWNGYRSSVSSHQASWGVSGITASTKDSIASVKFTFKKSNVQVQFNSVRIFCNFSNNNYDLQVGNAAIIAGVKSNVKDDFLSYRFKQNLDSLEIFLFKTADDTTSFDFYGIQLENDNNGFTYNSIGVNGSSFNSFARCEKFDNQYKYLHTDLAIISIGTNDSFDPDFDSLKFEMNYEQFILKLKKQNANLALLLTVPNDSYAKRKINNKNTVIVKRVIERLAYKYEAKIWDFFNIMGGNHSAKNWRDAELMKSDLIHFTRSGYLLKGSLLFDAIMSDFYKWKEQQNQKIDMNK